MFNPALAASPERAFAHCCWLYRDEFFGLNLKRLSCYKITPLETSAKKFIPVRRGAFASCRAFSFPGKPISARTFPQAQK
jgi:hypothetical protein